MNKLRQLFALALISISCTAARAQVDSFSATGYVNHMFCYQQILFTWNTGTLADSAVISIDWGDAVTEQLVYGGAPNSQQVLTFNHIYATQSDHQAIVSVTSDLTGMPVGTPQTITFINENATGQCGFAYLHTVDASPNITYTSVPYDFTDVNGNTTTINCGNIWGGYYFGLDPSLVPYSVSVNDQWLVNHGLMQVLPDYTISNFGATGLAEIDSMYMILDCDTANTAPDFALSYIDAYAFVAPLQTGVVTLSVCNLLCGATSDVTVSLDFPAGFVPVLSGLAGASVNGNTLTFDVEDLTECTYVTVPFTFPGNTAAGTQVCFSATLNGQGDNNPANDVASACTEVVNSYDPNDKQSDQPRHVNPFTAETFRYTVHFQNDGNYEALSVTVRDTLSENLDLSTFQLLDAKHGVTASVDPVTREAVFVFSSIHLAPSSDNLEASRGYVVYSIAENANLPIGAEIANTAFIYFDYNPPIVTNTTSSINEVTGINETELPAIVLFPNPASTDVHVEGAQVTAVQLLDLTGKIVLASDAVTGNSFSLDGISNGVYQAVITTPAGTQVRKLVVRR